MNVKTITALGLLTFGILAPLGHLTANDQPRISREEAEQKFPLIQKELDRKRHDKLVSYSEVLKEVTPAVVGVYPTSIVNVSNRAGRGSPLEEMLRRYYGIPDPQQGSNNEPEERRRPLGIGSGVIVSSDGYILTNNHVITDQRGNLADEVEVVLSDERKLKANVIGRDPRTDVAVLKVDATGLPFIPMADSEQLQVGDVVFAAGNPLSVGLTVTMGIVSAKGRDNLNILGSQTGLQGYEDFIQTDASINPGNSGGALVDAEGRLVGINTAIISGTGGNIGIGFAIPVNLARHIMISLLESGEVRRGFLGIRIRNLNADLASAFEFDSTKGALVEGVEEGLPASRAGIQIGDIITKVADRKISSSSDLRLTIAGTPPGTEVELEIFRKGKKQILPVVLGDLSNPTAQVFTSGKATERSLLEGVEAMTLTDDYRRQFEIPEDLKGLVITSVRGSSPYATTLRPGMVIVEVEGKPVQTVSEAKEHMVTHRATSFWVWENGAYGFVAIRLTEK